MKRNVLSTLLVVSVFWSLAEGLRALRSEPSNNTPFSKASESREAAAPKAHRKATDASTDSVQDQDEPQESSLEVSPKAIPAVGDLQVQEVMALKKDYPQSRQALFEKILEPDMAVSEGIEVQPHSLNEIQHRRQGALRVLALRVLLSSESDSNRRLQDLEHIASHAQDPTLKEIATAARRSYAVGRPFFEDYTRALARLPAEKEHP